MPIQERYNLRSRTRVIRGELVVSGALGNAICRSPRNSLGIIGIYRHIRKICRKLDIRLPRIPIQKRHSLSPCTSVIGGKSVFTDTFDKSILAAPDNGSTIIGILVHIVYHSTYINCISPGDVSTKASGRPKKESYDLGACAVIIRRKLVIARAIGYALSYRPVYGISIVCIRRNIREFLIGK